MAIIYIYLFFMAIISNSDNFKMTVFSNGSNFEFQGQLRPSTIPIVPRSGESGSEESPGAKAVRGLGAAGSSR